MRYLILLLLPSFLFSQNIHTMNGSPVYSDSKAGRSKQIEENYLGTIYNNNLFASASTGFRNQGTTVSLVGNGLQFSGGAGTFTETLSISTGSLVNPVNGCSMLDKWHMAVRVITTKTSSSYGFGIGKRSTNIYGSPNLLVRMDMTNGANSGQLIINGGTANAVLVTSLTNLSYVTGDSVLMTIDRDGYSVWATVRNLTSNSATITTPTFTYSTQPNADPYFDNTGQFSVFNFGGTFTVDSLNVTSHVVKNARVLIIGDSKMQGYDVTGQTFRFGDLMNNVFKSTVIHAGGYDRTVDASNTISEVIALAPQQVIDVIGHNDVGFGSESPTVYNARYDSIVNALTGQGIDVYHMPLYSSAISLAALLAHIQATFPANRILPSYPVLQRFGSLDVDGVHPLNYGDQNLFDMVCQTYTLFGSNTRYQSAFTPSLQQVTVAGNSTSNDIQITGNSNVPTTGSGMEFAYDPTNNWGIITAATRGSFAPRTMNIGGSFGNYLHVGAAPAASLDWITIDQDTTAGGVGVAPIRLIQGAGDPGTFRDGMIWYSAGHLHMRIGGTSYQLDQQGGGLSGLTTNQIQYATSSTAIGGATNFTVDPTNKILFATHLGGLGSPPGSSSLGTNVSSATVTKTDAGFKVVMVTTGAVSGTLFVITFANAYSSTPIYVVSSSDATTGSAIALSVGGYIAFNATSGTGGIMTGLITASGTYTFNFVGVGN